MNLLIRLWDRITALESVSIEELKNVQLPDGVGISVSAFEDS